MKPELKLSGPATNLAIGLVLFIGLLDNRRDTVGGVSFSTGNSSKMIQSSSSSSFCSFVELLKDDVDSCFFIFSTKTGGWLSSLFESRLVLSSLLLLLRSKSMFLGEKQLVFVSWF